GVSLRSLRLKAFLGCSSRPELALQLCLHPGPFSIQDAEVHRVTLSSIPGEHVFAQRTFFFCSQPKNGLPRTLVHGVGLKLYSQALPAFKGMAQHQVFGFGIDHGPLPWGSDPG